MHTRSKYLLEQYNRSTYSLTLRFLVDMPYGWVFIMFAVLLRMTEGLGSSMAFTAIYTLLPELYPTRVGLVTVHTHACLVSSDTYVHVVYVSLRIVNHISWTACSKLNLLYRCFYKISVDLPVYLDDDDRLAARLTVCGHLLLIACHSQRDVDWYY